MLFRSADRLREQLKGEKTFLLNLMSSPGSGKTTTLLRTVERLREEMRIGVMEADIDSDVDARTMADAGVRSIQLHTGGMCHLDAGMTGHHAVQGGPLGPLLDHCHVVSDGGAFNDQSAHGGMTPFSVCRQAWPWDLLECFILSPYRGKGNGTQGAVERNQG